MARIHYINNDGCGFADAREIPEGTTVSQFLANEGITNPSRYNIRLNNVEVIPEQVLSDGVTLSATRPGTIADNQVLHSNDRVTIMPKNVGGAC